MAEIFQQRGIKVVALVTSQHSAASSSKRADGKKLTDFADLVLDTGAPVGDAMVYVPNLDTPVAPGSTIGGATLINCLKAETARLLTEAGQPPKVLSAAAVVGSQRAVELFEAAYDEHAHRIAKMYEKVGIQSYVSTQNSL
jgi:uncharacterized phosphosugar-binding protein